MITDEKELKAMFKQTFDTVAGGYDSPALRFFPDSAKYLKDLLDLNGDEAVLDVATGTGHAAFELSRHLPDGHVHGIDFSSGMLARAAEKRVRMGIDNVQFSQMDMQAIAFPDAAFDIAVCSFCIFFVEDMAGLLRHVSEKVKPGGKVIAITFYRKLFAPLNDLFLERIKPYDVRIPKMTWRRTASEEKCRELFQSAGLNDIQICRKDLGYYIPDIGQWWEIVWNAGFRGLVEQLSAKQHEAFKTAHLEEVQELMSEKGIRLDIKALYTMGTVQQP